MRVDAARLRGKALGTTSNGNGHRGGAGANPTMPRSTAYRDDLPEAYRDRMWAVNLEADPGVIDELKKSAGYVEPEGSGRWGVPARIAVARTMAEARGVPAPMSIGRECGNCIHYESEERSFEDRIPGACRKLRVVVFGNAGCVLARPFGPQRTSAPEARPPQQGEAVDPIEEGDDEPVERGEGGQLYQNDLIEKLREEKGIRFSPAQSPEGKPAAYREKPSMPPAV